MSILDLNFDQLDAAAEWEALTAWEGARWPDEAPRIRCSEDEEQP